MAADFFAFIFGLARGLVDLVLPVELVFEGAVFLSALADFGAVLFDVERTAASLLAAI